MSNLKLGSLFTVAVLTALLLSACRQGEGLAGGVWLEYGGLDREAVLVCVDELTSVPRFAYAPGDLLVSDVMVEREDLDDVRTWFAVTGLYTADSLSGSPSQRSWTCEVQHKFGQYDLVGLDIEQE